MFSMVLSLLHGSTWSDSYVNYTMFFIHCNKRSVVDSRKPGGYVYLRKNHYSPSLLEVSIYPTELVAVIFVWKVLCLMHETLSAIPFNYSTTQLNPITQRPWFLGLCDTAIKFLRYLILMRTFQNWPNKLHSISDFEKITSSYFRVLFFVCK